MENPTQEKFVKLTIKDGLVILESQGVNELEMLGMIERVKYQRLATASEKAKEYFNAQKAAKDLKVNLDNHTWTWKKKSNWKDIPGMKNLRFKKMELSITPKKKKPAAKKKAVKKTAKSKK